MSNNYINLLRKLYKVNLFHPTKVGLNSINSIYKLLGKPLDHIPVIHVGGSNGKGSVALKIFNVLKSANLNTGIYMSPHINTFRERIQVNDNYITKDDIETMLPEVFNLIDKNKIPATFFEITTALSFLKFLSSKCDVIVLEVGLGGRLDATNIINNTALSVITSIQYDHMNVLGSTLEEIAYEKSGIIKNNSIYGVLVGPGCPHNILQQQTKNINDKLNYFESWNEILLSSENRLYPTNNNNNNNNLLNRFGIISGADIDDLNTDIARCAINILTGDSYYYSRNNTIINNSYILTRRYYVLNEALAKLKSEQITNNLKIRPHGRFELVHINNKLSNGRYNFKNEEINNHTIISKDGINIIFDIAHNQGAIMSLIEKIKLTYKNQSISYKFVIGMSADKDIINCIKVIHDSNILYENIDSNIYCIEAQHPRAISREKLLSIIDTVCNNNNNIGIIIPSDKNDNIHKTMNYLIENGLKFNSNNNNNRQVIIVFGTAFILADAKKSFGYFDIFDSKSNQWKLNNNLIDDFNIF